MADLDHILREHRTTQQDGGGTNEYVQLDLHANTSSWDMSTNEIMKIPSAGR
jgi:hypothetical protein